MLCCYVVMPVMYSNVKSLLFHENNTTFVVAMLYISKSRQVAKASRLFYILYDML